MLFANADLKELEQDIRSTGFYHNKAVNIIACAKRLIEVYGGVVPSELEDLLTLAGVGRKTANVIRGNIYNQPSIVVDTHFKRISKRFGFTKESDPEKIEMDLMKVLPKEDWILYNIALPRVSYFLVVPPVECRGNIVGPPWAQEKSMKQEGGGRAQLLKERHSPRVQHKPIKIKWVQDGRQVKFY